MELFKIMAENKSTTVYISSEEVIEISKTLIGVESISSFVHLSISELIEKRRQQKVA